MPENIRHLNGLLRKYQFILFSLIILSSFNVQANNVPLIHTQTVTINASAQKVYNTLLEFDTYQIWNPWLYEATGDPTLGGNVWAKLHLDNREMESNHTITSLKPNEVFCWRDEMWYSFLAGGKRCRSLTPVSNNQTLISGTFQFNGWIAGLSYLLYKDQMLQGMTNELIGLKNHLEK